MEDTVGSAPCWRNEELRAAVPPPNRPNKVSFSPGLLTCVSRLSEHRTVTEEDDNK